jgi:hypothetical protein
MTQQAAPQEGLGLCDNASEEAGGNEDLNKTSLIFTLSLWWLIIYKRGHTFWDRQLQDARRCPFAEGLLDRFVGLVQRHTSQNPIAPRVAFFEKHRKPLRQDGRGQGSLGRQNPRVIPLLRVCVRVRGVSASKGSCARIAPDRQLDTAVSAVLLFFDRRR